MTGLKHFESIDSSGYTKVEMSDVKMADEEKPKEKKPMLGWVHMQVRFFTKFCEICTKSFDFTSFLMKFQILQN